ncbi:uncharacterized protein SOCG_05167 [Schizosaccharomyces octosporus yFS286]|uniref:Uncharacterized protein n=1 Tax=Schizosaccharomyces octosporus (strain yFS286) TaxID=483514 RepID=S9R7Z2_SCHOY|nr:uncharacterized protein SOCG_05167 [Schizosaccharomyces octosporus yFS286]EPX74355.1 hypothetical protein SOCG_05167 [Schizosaccharomyces octosporus yFS286]
MDGMAWHPKALSLDSRSAWAWTNLAGMKTFSCRKYKRKIFQKKEKDKRNKDKTQEKTLNKNERPLYINDNSENDIGCKV